MRANGSANGICEGRQADGKVICEEECRASANYRRAKVC
jgi:hypothetical protein